MKYFQLTATLMVLGFATCDGAIAATPIASPQVSVALSTGDLVPRLGRLGRGGLTLLALGDDGDAIVHATLSDGRSGVFRANGDAFQELWIQRSDDQSLVSPYRIKANAAGVIIAPVEERPSFQIVALRRIAAPGVVELLPLRVGDNDMEGNSICKIVAYEINDIADIAVHVSVAASVADCGFGRFAGDSVYVIDVDGVHRVGAQIYPPDTMQLVGLTHTGTVIVTSARNYPLPGGGANTFIDILAATEDGVRTLFSGGDTGPSGRPLSNPSLAPYQPRVTQAGDVVFFASDNEVRGAYLLRGGDLHRVFSFDEEAPNGGRNLNFSDAGFAISDSGDIAVAATWVEFPPLYAAGYRSGVFLYSPSGDRRVLRLGSEAPQFGRFVYPQGGMFLNGSDQVALPVNASGASMVLRWSADELSKVVASGDLVDGKAIIATGGFELPSLGHDGQVLVYGYATSGASGLVCSDGDGPSLIVKIGDPAPKGGSFSGIYTPSLGPPGTTYFHASVTIPPDDGSNPQWGVYAAAATGITRAVGNGDITSTGSTVDGIRGPFSANESVEGVAAHVGLADYRAAVVVRRGNGVLDSPIESGLSFDDGWQLRQIGPVALLEGGMVAALVRGEKPGVDDPSRWNAVVLAEAGQTRLLVKVGQPDSPGEDLGYIESFQAAGPWLLVQAIDEQGKVRLFTYYSSDNRLQDVTPDLMRLSYPYVAGITPGGKAILLADDTVRTLDLEDGSLSDSQSFAGAAFGGFNDNGTLAVQSYSNPSMVVLTGPTPARAVCVAPPTALPHLTETPTPTPSATATATVTATASVTHTPVPSSTPTPQVPTPTISPSATTSSSPTLPPTATATALASTSSGCAMMSPNQDSAMPFYPLLPVILFLGRRSRLWMMMVVVTVMGIRSPAPAAELAYLLQPSRNEIAAVDLAQQRVVGTIALAESIRPTALASTRDGRFVYATDSDRGDVAVLDTVTDKVIARIPLAGSSILIPPNSDRAYVGSECGLTVLDTLAMSPLRTFPWSLQLSPDGSRGFIVGDRAVFVDTASGARVSSLSGRADKAVFTADSRTAYYWRPSTSSQTLLRRVNLVSGNLAGTLAVSDAVTAAAFSPDSTRLYTLGNTLSVYDVLSEQPLKSIDERGIFLFAPSPDGKNLFAVRVQGNPLIHELLTIDAQTFGVVRRTRIPGRANSLTFTPAGRELLLTVPDERAVIVVNADSGEATATIELGDPPPNDGVSGADYPITFSNAQRAYIGTRGGLLRLDLASGQVGVVVAASRAVGLAANVVRSELYVTHQGAKSMTIIDATRNAIVGSIALGGEPTQVVVSADGRLAYVTLTSPTAGEGALATIDLSNRTVVVTRQLSTETYSQYPVQIALSRDPSKAYLSINRTPRDYLNFETRLVVIDLNDGSVEAESDRIFFYAHLLHESAVDGILYVAGGSYSLSRLSSLTGAIEPVATFARPIADFVIAPDGQAYVLNFAASGGLQIDSIDLSRGSIDSTIPIDLTSYPPRLATSASVPLLAWAGSTLLSIQASRYGGEVVGRIEAAAPIQALAVLSLPNPPTPSPLPTPTSDGEGGRLFVGTDDGRVQVLDGLQVTATISLHGRVIDLAAAPGGQTLYALVDPCPSELCGLATVVAIDVAERKVVKTAALVGYPLHLALSGDGRTAFASTNTVQRGAVHLIDTGRMIQTGSIADGTYPNVLSVAGDGHLYVGSQLGLLIVDPSTLSIESTISLSGYPTDITIAGGRDELYIGVAGGAIDVVDPRAGIVTRTIPADTSRSGFAWSATADGSFSSVRTTCYFAAFVPAAASEPSAYVPLAEFVLALKADTDGRFVYALSQGGQLSMIDASLRVVRRSTTLGVIVTTLAIAPEALVPTPTATMTRSPEATRTATPTTTSTVTPTATIGTSSTGNGGCAMLNNPIEETKGIALALVLLLILRRRAWRTPRVWPG